MTKKLLIAFIASLAIGAQASPIVFTNTAYDTTAFAVVGALADAQSAASPPTALPLLSSATVVGVNDFATSSAFGTSGLLFAQSEADSFTGGIGANSGAQSHFVGSILNSGILNLQLDFTNLTSLVGNAFADGTLFVLLTNTVGNTTTTLLDTFYTNPGLINLRYGVAGGVTKLDLLLFSEAGSTGAGQSGQNFAQVGITGTVPLPATPFLLLAGLGAMLVVRRKSTGTAV